MALEETRTFLEDLLLRFDPSIDISDGSRAQSELIDPVLQRIGPDPFEGDIAVFVRDRIRQVFPNLAITEADDLTDTLIDPMRVLIEPVAREIKLVKLRSSLRNIESLGDDEVDALMSNFFETRRAGGFAVGVVRASFSAPQSISISQINSARTRGGLRFFPTRPQQITADQMRLNPDGAEYYFDINYTAENQGEEYNVEAGEISSIANFPTAVRVSNLRRFRDGAPRESSVEFAARTEASVSDKTLTVSRGIIRTLSEAFPALRRLFVVGFRDPEMQRDVIRGGGFGGVPVTDAFGSYFGTATPVDDLDTDFTTPVIEVAVGVGAFVSRVGAVGTAPVGWFMTLVYNDGTLHVLDTAITEVVSDSRVRIADEVPTSLGTGGVTWALRRQQLTISDIPGGITLPDTADGLLEVRNDEVHIGGKTDVYVAGETESATAQITGLTDESPLLRGDNAESDAALTTVISADIIVINDATYTNADVETGMSLVLEEGVDAGSYRIIEIAPGGNVKQLRLDQEMTGTQANLAWKIVDEIDVELTDPKDVKAEGDDLVIVAGNPVVTTTGAFNFLDANVQEEDILEISGDELSAGDYTITDVSAVSLEVNPAPPRTVSLLAWRVFRRSEAVSPPLVRISGLELLDSAGAPVGTAIPYRDPVLALSRGFGNESTGFVYDGLVVTGLVSGGIATDTTGYAVSGLALGWAIYDPDRIWAGALNTHLYTFAGGPVRTADQVVSEINANINFNTENVRAVKIQYAGQDFVGISGGTQLIVFYQGAALAALGITAGLSNASLRAVASNSFIRNQVRQGDLVEIVDGNNSSTQSRIVVQPTGDTADAAVLGNGPVGPLGVSTAVAGIAGISRLYNNTLLLPDVGARARVARPTVGSARTFFLKPTSAEFDALVTRYSVETATQTLVYRPDPENFRVRLPAPPLTDLPKTATTTPPVTITDTLQNFLKLEVHPGDLIDVLYRPIDGSTPLASPANIAVGSKAFVLRLREDPAITIQFPFDMSRQDVVDYINDQIGEDIAFLVSGALRLQPTSSRLEIRAPELSLTSALGTLFLTAGSNEHPSKGTYVVRGLSATALTLSSDTPMTGSAVPNTQYQVRRHVQRISSTEMSENQDASGLYYADVELIATGPGDQHNIESGVAMDISGTRGDGFRLSVENSVLSFSRAEILRAEVSRSILLVGSSDSPEEYVQISQQNVQVNYDRSQLTDEVQGFVDSDFERVVNEEILVRHLLPHYVLLNWRYVGGSAEPDMVRALEVLLDAVEPNTELEVKDLVSVLDRRGATSVYTPDTDSPTGRTAPLFLVVYHDTERRIRGLQVRDFVDTVRTQRFIPDSLVLSRVSTSGIR